MTYYIGYTGDGRTCSDINECILNNGGCSVRPHVTCVNTPGSFTCEPCPEGYSGNGQACVFVGLCAVNNGGCHPTATCQEHAGMVDEVRIKTYLTTLHQNFITLFA